MFVLVTTMALKLRYGKLGKLTCTRSLSLRIQFCSSAGLAQDLLARLPEDVEINTEHQRLATRPKHFLIASASLVRPTGTAHRSAQLEHQVEGIDSRRSVYKAGLRPNGWFSRLFPVLMQPGFWRTANLRRLLTSSRQISSRRASSRLPSSEPACPRQPSSGPDF